MRTSSEPMRAIRPAHLILFDSVTFTIFGKSKVKLSRSHTIAELGGRGGTAPTRSWTRH
jgi:hypothetical protein